MSSIQYSRTDGAKIGERAAQNRAGGRETELAERLSVALQQVQRYEATKYWAVAVERLQEVADALRLKVREVFTLEPG
ncbi:MAG: hypothetical protein ABI589_14860 [Burkholderiales bacterium]